MDMGLPDINGTEVTKQIRNWEKSSMDAFGHSRRLPIVALTAHTLDAAADRFSSRIH
jgi:CheY-like chemotaxis protein